MPDALFTEIVRPETQDKVLTPQAVEAAWEAIEAGCEEGDAEPQVQRLVDWLQGQPLQGAFRTLDGSAGAGIVPGKTTLSGMSDEFYNILQQIIGIDDASFGRGQPGEIIRERFTDKATNILQAGLNAAAETLDTRAPSLSQSAAQSR